MPDDPVFYDHFGFCAHVSAIRAFVRFDSFSIERNVPTTGITYTLEGGEVHRILYPAKEDRDRVFSELLDLKKP